MKSSYKDKSISEDNELIQLQQRNVRTKKRVFIKRNTIKTK